MATGFSRWGVSLALLAATALAAGAAAAQGAQPEAKACENCHLTTISEPIVAMMNSAHWNADNPASPGSRGGCQTCHGNSAGHANAPIAVIPDVAFGPRRTSAPDAQNNACQSCHGASHPDWAQTRHAAINMTCSACHKTHEDHDPALVASNQQNACSTCHAPQKGMHQVTPGGPACASCHDPHAATQPAAVMLTNGSAGCRTCHDLGQMAASGNVPARTNQIHNAMTNPERSCVDCHVGIAHESPGGGDEPAD